jgi:hypothetical protein
MSTLRKTKLDFKPVGAMDQPAMDIKDYEARIIKKALEDDIKARMPDQDQNPSGIDNTTTGNKIMQTIKDLAKDPRTYSTLANIGSIYAATQDDPTTASALSEVASRIDTGIQEKQAAEAAVEAERIKAEADAEKAEKDRAALIEAAEKRGLKAQELGQSIFKPAPGFIKANPQMDFLDDAQAQKEGLTQTDIDTGVQYVNVNKVPKYLEDKELEKINLESSIADTKRRNIQINEIITDPGLQELIGKESIFGIDIGKKFLKSITGTPEELESLLESINTLDSDKVLETLKKLKSQSKTGSTGFGALNTEELKIIKNALASLNTSQDLKTFVKNVKLIDKTFSDATERAQKNYLEKYKGKGIELYQNPYSPQTIQKRRQEKLADQARTRALTKSISDPQSLITNDSEQKSMLFTGQPQSSKSGISWSFE